MAFTEDDSGFNHTPELPVSISQIGDRYLVFDIKVVTWLRREHHICGAMVGTLPQSPSQNLFLGLPVEIMPEEAQLLVEKGVGVITDDARAHDQALQRNEAARRAEYISRLDRQTKKVERLRAKEKEESRKKGLSKRTSRTGNETPKLNDKPTAQSILSFEDDDDGGHNQHEESQAPTDPASPPPLSSSVTPTPAPEETATQDDSPIKILTQTAQSTTYAVTLTTSRRLLYPPSPQPQSETLIPNLPPTYPLYRHLHDRGYYMTPGLRFGCQYAVYPGDPLRFHSHFLAVGTGWDEEIDLMDIVGGGRLGTGVKKGFLIGGEEDKEGEESRDGGKRKVRTFSVEWAAM